MTNSWKSGFKAGAVLGLAIVCFNLLLFFFIWFYTGVLGLVADLISYYNLVLIILSNAFVGSLLYGAIGGAYTKVEKRIPVKNMRLKSTTYFVAIMAPIAIFSSLSGLNLWSGIDNAIAFEAGNFTVKTIIWGLGFPVLLRFFDKRLTDDKISQSTQQASITRRTAAFLIDLAITLFIIDIILVLNHHAIYGMQGILYEEVRITVEAYSPFLIIPIPFIYWTLLEGLFGQTLGKKALGLRVMGKGKRIGLLAAAIRNLPKYLLLGDPKTLILLIFDSLGFIPTNKKQRFSDVLTSTKVVRVK